MPVQNIHRSGSLMFNKTPEGGVLADCVTSVFGDIFEDDDFDKADFELIKDKDPSVAKHWQYLTEAQAKSKRKERAELEAIDAEAEEARNPSNQPGAFLDSTGLDGDETIEQKMKADQAASKTAPNKAANTDGD